jgi:hypothetical protein
MTSRGLGHLDRSTAVLIDEGLPKVTTQTRALAVPVGVPRLEAFSMVQSGRDRDARLLQGHRRMTLRAHGQEFAHEFDSRRASEWRQLSYRASGLGLFTNPTPWRRAAGYWWRAGRPAAGQLVSAGA